jgi:hypothetical protein
MSIHLKKSKHCGEYWNDLEDPEATKKQLVKRYAQPVFRGLLGDMSSRIPLPEDWNPQIAPHTTPTSPPDSTSAAAAATTAAATTPDGTIDDSTPFLDVVGWRTWFKCTGAESEHLLKYIAPPQSRLTRRHHPHYRYIETGLVAVRTFGKKYLMDANDFVESQNSQVRDAITVG